MSRSIRPVASTSTTSPRWTDSTTPLRVCLTRTGAALHLDARAAAAGLAPALRGDRVEGRAAMNAEDSAGLARWCPSGGGWCAGAPVIPPVRPALTPPNRAIASSRGCRLGRSVAGSVVRLPQRHDTCPPRERWPPARVESLHRARQAVAIGPIHPFAPVVERADTVCCPSESGECPSCGHLSGSGGGENQRGRGPSTAGETSESQRGPPRRDARAR